MARRILAAGNWKMNKTPSEAAATIEAMKATCASDTVDVLLCVPAIDIPAAVAAAKGSNIQIGAENVYFKDSGAFTGEISADMLLDAGIKYVILGHSERREYFAETNETVNAKMLQCFAKGLIPIMCCGETLTQREQGVTMDFIRQQVKVGFLGLTGEQAKQAVIAYEPIWAIGTGKSADVNTAESCCKLVRDTVKALYDEATAEAVRIQYGGSVKPNNIAEYMACPDIDGALIGGASLKVDSFKALVDATK